MANPILSASVILELVTPITSPAAFIIGPPLLPGFTAASVCIKTLPPIICFADDTMPSVMVNGSPRGKPRTETLSIFLTVSWRLNSISGRLKGFSDFRKAISLSGSTRTTFAIYFSLFWLSTATFFAP